MHKYDNLDPQKSQISKRSTFRILPKRKLYEKLGLSSASDIFENVQNWKIFTTRMPQW